MVERERLRTDLRDLAKFLPAALRSQLLENELVGCK